jgi:hypothetical protein
MKLENHSRLKYTCKNSSSSCLHDECLHASTDRWEDENSAETHRQTDFSLAASACLTAAGSPCSTTAESLLRARRRRPASHSSSLASMEPHPLGGGRIPAACSAPAASSVAAGSPRCARQWRCETPRLSSAALQRLSVAARRWSLSVVVLSSTMCGTKERERERELCG